MPILQPNSCCGGGSACLLLVGHQQQQHRALVHVGLFGLALSGACSGHVSCPGLNKQIMHGYGYDVSVVGINTGVG